MKKLILGLVLAFAANVAMADIVKNYDLEGGLTATLDDQGVLTIIGSGAMPDWGFVFQQAWKNERTQIKSVIAEGVTSVGQNAFYGCSSLTNALVSSATSIGKNAFYNCSALAEISLPNVATIGNSAFYKCSSLTNALVSSATSIGADAFYNCSALKTVTAKDRAMKAELENNRSYYGLGAGVTIVNGSIVKTYVLNDDLTAELESDGTLTIIGSGAMPDWDYSFNQAWKDESDQIKSVVAEGVTAVGRYAFGDCSNLTNISFSTAISVGESAFDG